MSDRPFEPAECSAAILAQAFAGVRESGRWSVEQSAELERVVRDRARELGGYIRQLVRLVRLAALCSKSSYLEFFYGGAGGADDFHRTAARAVLPPDVIVIEADRI